MAIKQRIEALNKRLQKRGVARRWVVVEAGGLPADEAEAVIAKAKADNPPGTGFIVSRYEEAELPAN